jgi:hypothetical protein
MVNKRKPSTVKKRSSVVAPVRFESPAALTVDEQNVWDDLLREATWLTKFDRYNLHMYCCAVAKYQRDPQSASNALVSRVKSLGSKLHFDNPPIPIFPARTDADRFFDDGPLSPEETRGRSKT